MCQSCKLTNFNFIVVFWAAFVPIDLQWSFHRRTQGIWHKTSSCDHWQCWVQFCWWNKMGPLPAISFKYALRQKVGEIYISGQFHQCLRAAFTCADSNRQKIQSSQSFQRFWDQHLYNLHVKWNDGKIDPWSQFHQHLTQVFFCTKTNWTAFL